jgi:hypothetical protein
MKEPFFGQQYKKTGSGARKKGDPMDEETLRRLDAEFGKVMLPMRLVL